MPCLTPYLINLIMLALDSEKYPNVKRTGPDSFSIYCPRKDSKDFTPENIQVFIDWDIRKGRESFDYTKSRQRLLAALIRSVYLSLMNKKKDWYEFHLNNKEEIAAKRLALKQKRRASNYGSDGESLPPSSPESAPSPFDEFSSHSPMDLSDEQIELVSDLPVLFPELCDQNAAFQNGNVAPVSPAIGSSVMASSSLETTENQVSIDCSSVDAEQVLFGAQFNAELLTYLGLQGNSSLMETYADSAVPAEVSTSTTHECQEQSLGGGSACLVSSTSWTETSSDSEVTAKESFTPFVFKDMNLGDELPDTIDGIPMNDKHPDVSQPQATVTPAVDEDNMSLRTNENLLAAGTSLQPGCDAPSNLLDGDAVQLKILEVFTLDGNVTAYLISVSKFGISH